MTDIGVLTPSTDLFDTRRKNGADAASGAFGAGAFQQQLSQALGLNNSDVQQSTTDTAVGQTESPAKHKVGMAAPQSSVATFQAAESAQGSGARALTDYMSMPLSEKMFYMILAGMGISKDQYDAMSPQEKAQVAVKVEDRIKQAAATSDASQADNATAQNLRSAPVEQAGNTAKTRDGADNYDSLLLA